jgi:transposase-like protein
MTKIQIIHCPNCGDRATKEITDNDIQRIACRNCDYLLVQCAKTAKVIEAYAPGFNSYSVTEPTPA